MSSGDSAATIAASPDARRAGRSMDAASRTSDSQLLLADGAARIMLTDEAARALAFARVVVFLSGIGIVALPFLHSSRPLYWPMAATVVSLFASSSFMWWRARGGKEHTRGAVRVFAGACVAFGLFVVYDLGVFSPAPLFVTLGIAFVAQSHDRALGNVAIIACVALYFLLALLIMVGTLPDLGLFSISAGSLGARLLMLVIVPASFAVAAWQGRASRRATLAAMEQSHEALRLALTREAQL